MFRMSCRRFQLYDLRCSNVLVDAGSERRGSARVTRMSRHLLTLAHPPGSAIDYNGDTLPAPAPHVMTPPQCE